MYLELNGISKAFSGKQVVNDLSLSLEKGQLMCILGSSGCGKTTTLNMIGGFLAPDKGSIMLDGEEITHIPPEKRPVTTVFQSYGLFMHMNVLQNVIYGLRFRGYGRKEAVEKGMKYLEMVDMSEYAEASVARISGGQQQRTALARALIVEPKLCLLDEPFCNLDASLRVRMRSELKKIQRELDMTMVFVTHDQEEALILSDSMAVMEGGRLVQVGTPESIYKHPASKYVADFLHTDEMIWQDDTTVLKKIDLGDRTDDACRYARS